MAGLRARLAGLFRPRGATLDDCQVYAMRLQGRRGVAGSLRRLSPVGDYAQAMIDPAGTRVAFWGAHPATPGHQLWVADIATRRCRPISLASGLTGHPCWWPDGRSLVCFSTAGVSDATDWQPARQFDPDRPAANLFRIDPASGARQPLTRGDVVDERPAVTPDGAAVIFVSSRGGRLNLWALDVADGGLRQLSHGVAFDYRPAISPDSTRIAYFTADADGRHVLAMLSWPAATPLAVKVNATFDWVHGPYWAADGRALLVHARKAGAPRPALWLIDTADGGVEPLALPGVEDCSHGTWDAGEGWLAFDSRQALGQLPATIDAPTC
ncbi:MAG: hypothetical protein RIM84_03245 [Alphaproteobacteria bacterium]